MLLTAGLPIKHMQQQGMNVGLPGRWKDPNYSLAAIVKRYRQEAEPGTKARHSKVGCKCLNQQVNIYFLVATFSLFLSIFACSLSQCYRNRDKDRDTLWGFPTSHGTDSWGWPGRSQQLSPHSMSWQQSKHLGLLPLPSTGHWEGAVLQMDQQGLQPTPTLATGTTGGSFTHYEPLSLPLTETSKTRNLG